MIATAANFMSMFASADDGSSSSTIAQYFWVFGQGVLVDFTPCVYPLIPITVSLFGARGVSKARALFLAGTYVLGMAIFYTTLGVAVAYTGSSFGVWLGNAWVILPLAALLVALAASMFGAFELQLPSSLQTKLGTVGGSGPAGAFIMGLVSGLVAAPCTGPVLLGILAQIATASAKGQGVAYGGSLLFVYALGMGTLFFAVAMGASLFRPGVWMEHVKSFFGIALLVMAFWFLRPLSPALRSFFVVDHFGIVYGLGIFILGSLSGAIHLSFHGSRNERLRKAAAVVVATLGGCVVLNNALHVKLNAQWHHVADMQGLEQIISRAETQQRPILIDFGAEWCTPCKELELQTFSRPEVESELAKFELIKIDVTDPTPEQENMKVALHAETLPSVVAFPAAMKLSAHVSDIRNGRPLPPPQVHVKTFVGPEQFLELLRPVLP